MRADIWLVEHGLADTRSQAQRLIADGATFLKNGTWQPLAKNTQLGEVSEVRLASDAERRYVSRAGLKLEGALVQSGVDVADKTCLDVGQSTGGFTDCLLQHGAARVVGLDVGHGQLHPRMAAHPAVQCIEKINARNVDELAAVLSEFSGEQRFDVLVMDVSFISLTLVLPMVLPYVGGSDAGGGQLLLLVKPQFELQPEYVGKGGVVRDAALYAEVRRKIEACCAKLGLTVQAWLDSAIEGGDGNREFFIHAIKS